MTTRKRLSEWNRSTEVVSNNPSYSEQDVEILRGTAMPTFRLLLLAATSELTAIHPA